MEIVTEVPMWKAIERELRTGFELQRQTEVARERAAAAQAAEGRGKVAAKGGMELRKIASVPSRDFFQIGAKYGNEAWHDDEFLADFKKRNDHLTTDFCPTRKRMKSVAR